MAEEKKCLRDKVPADSLTGLFMQISHKICNGSEEEIVNDRLFYNMEKHDKGVPDSPFGEAGETAKEAVKETAKEAEKAEEVPTAEAAEPKPDAKGERKSDKKKKEKKDGDAEKTDDSKE